MGSLQIGRIPKEWARCLLPPVRDKKIRIEGCCKYAPDVLNIMDTIDLSIRYAQSLLVNSLVVLNCKELLQCCVVWL